MRNVTVDTGGLDDVFLDALVTWLCVPSGGYGFTVRIPARVLNYTRTGKVTIEVTALSGEKAETTVDARNLRWAK